MPTALITGANRGLGYQLARELGMRGWQVIVTARAQKKSEDAAARLRQETGSPIRAVELDVTDPATIAEAHRQLREDGTTLDALVNNAGVYRGHDARGTLETNFFGALRVTEAFKDLLNPGARVVNVSSGLGDLSNLNASHQHALTDPKLTRDRLVDLVHGYLDRGEDWGTSAYGVSKAALNALSRVYAEELADRGIKVNSANPGWARTDMGGHGAPRSVEEGAASILWAVLLDSQGPTGGVFQDGARVE